MLNALYSAATGIEAQQLRISVISNNLANMSTSGFKQSRAVFQDLIYQTQQQAGATTTAGEQLPSGIQVGTGVKVVSTPVVFSQGIMEQTARDLDIAIEGDGFLGVSANGQTAYTRAGSLSVSATGSLVTQQGYELNPPVSGLAGVSGLTITSDGAVNGITPGQTTATTLGNLSLSTFANPSGLSAKGSNLFMETAASGTPTSNTPGQSGAGTIRQGFLESSNVNIADELIKMILAQRSFEMNSKVVKTADEMMGSMNQLR